MLKVVIILTDDRPIRLAYKLYFFNQRTIFFSHTKSANITFSHDLSAKQAQANRAIMNMNIQTAAESKRLDKDRESKLLVWTTIGSPKQLLLFVLQSKQELWN